MLWIQVPNLNLLSHHICGVVVEQPTWDWKVTDSTPHHTHTSFKKNTYYPTPPMVHAWLLAAPPGRMLGVTGQLQRKYLVVVREHTVMTKWSSFTSTNHCGDCGSAVNPDPSDLTWFLSLIVL